MYSKSNKALFEGIQGEIQLSKSTLGSTSIYYYIPSALYYGI